MTSAPVYESNSDHDEILYSASFAPTEPLDHLRHFERLHSQAYEPVGEDGREDSHQAFNPWSSRGTPKEETIRLTAGDDGGGLYRNKLARGGAPRQTADGFARWIGRFPALDGNTMDGGATAREAAPLCLRGSRKEIIEKWELLGDRCFGPGRRSKGSTGR